MLDVESAGALGAFHHGSMSQTHTLDELEAIARAREMARSGRAEEILRNADVSFAEVAGVIGVDDACVWQWCRGKSRPTGDRALRFLHCLDRLASI